MQAGIVYPSARQIGHALGVSSTAARKWRKEGMPNSTIAAAREWMEAHKPKIGRRMTTVQEEIKLPLVVLPDNEDPQQVVKRLRLAERTIAGHINGWLDIALPEALKERDKAK